MERRGSGIGLVCIAPQQWRFHRVVQVGWSWLRLNDLRLDLICCYMEQHKYKMHEDLNWNAEKVCLTQQLLLKPSCTKPSAGGDLEDRVWCGRLFGKLGRSDNFHSQRLCQLLLDQSLFLSKFTLRSNTLPLSVSWKSHHSCPCSKVSIIRLAIILNFQWIFLNFHFS